jgi:hypothetical protein
MILQEKIIKIILIINLLVVVVLIKLDCLALKKFAGGFVTHLLIQLDPGY